MQMMQMQMQMQMQIPLRYAPVRLCMLDRVHAQVSRRTHMCRDHSVHRRVHVHVRE